jgi:hypothetical protein
LSETYSKAEGYAFQIECENMNSMSKRIDSINNLVQTDGTMDLLNQVGSSKLFNFNGKTTYINNYDLILVHALDAISKVILSGTVRASRTKKERK